MRHALVDQKKCHRIVTLLQLIERFQSRLSRVRPENAILLRIPLPEIAFYGSQNFGIIVDGQNRWLRHFFFQDTPRPFFAIGRWQVLLRIAEARMPEKYKPRVANANLLDLTRIN